MSLDVCLVLKGVQNLSEGEHIFIREDGQNKEISRKEWDNLFPRREPVVVNFPSDDDYVYSSNITHNLGKMASEAGIYEALWRPEEIGITKAGQLINPLQRGLNLLRSDPDRFDKLSASNGWGTYDQFVPWVQNYLDACEQYPDAEVHASR